MNLKNRTILKYICIILVFINCKSNKENKVGDGIFIEKINENLDDDNAYNNDNVIYRVGKKFEFDYYYITRDDKCFFKFVGEDWKFTTEFENDSSAVKSFTMKIANGNPMKKHVTDYDQTNIFYFYPTKKYYNSTGLVENGTNVWMHPPREGLFRILELNPFPFIKKPFSIGTTWDWKLKYGENWGDRRWKKWNGTIESEIKYKIIKKEKIETNLGLLECFVISGISDSSLGKTKLISFFNEQYGFVKLEYFNINNSKIVIDLREIH